MRQEHKLLADLQCYLSHLSGGLSRHCAAKDSLRQLELWQGQAKYVREMRRGSRDVWSATIIDYYRF